VSQEFIPATPIYSFFRTLCRIVTTYCFDLKCYGAENVPLTGGCLLLCNHQSFLDPPCITTQLRRPASFLAKSELFDVPIFGRVIPKLNAFPVRQGAGDIGAVRETIRRLKEGHLLTLFPEGARTDTGEMQPLQGGFTLVVRKVDVPIVPVAIDGSFKAWKRGAILPQRAPVRVQYGPPLDVKKLKPAEIVPVVDAAIRGLLAQIRQREHSPHAGNTGGVG
jgi:1-acyl-sn-glycerol-3-phosphate acyltransferase